MRRAARIALEAYRAFSTAVEAGGATILTVPGAPGSPMVNRVLRLGVDRPATEADVDAALAAVPAGVTYYVAVDPEARPAELPAWLAARGLEPGWGWMAFERGAGDPPRAETSLRLMTAEPGSDLAAEFGRVARVGYELPEAAERTLARSPEAGWECWLALDGDEPAGVAALYPSGGAAYLGLAATLPEHRGKGAQTALLATRIRRAAERGCDLVVTETGERRGDRPSNSYRNIVRAGFRETAVTANWLGHA